MKILLLFFVANRMNRFIDYKLIISEKTGKYPFPIANTDSAEENGTQWWSILDIEPKADPFFLIHLELKV